MHKILTLGWMFLTLTACAGRGPSATPVYLASGETAYKVTCYEPGLVLESCYEKAGDLCRLRGYQELPPDPIEQMQTVLDLTGAVLEHPLTNPAIKKHILIRCL